MVSRRTDKMSELQVFLNFCLTFLLWFVFVPATAQGALPVSCPSNLSPCNCSSYNSPTYGYLSITCDGNDFADGQALKSVLSPPFPNDPSIALTLKDIFFPLPANLLGDKKQLDFIRFTCSDKDRSLGPIDALAFVGSSLAIPGIAFLSCNLSETSLEFLGLFSRLETLGFFSCELTRFVNFPYIPTLVDLRVYGSSLEEWYPRVNTPNLKTIGLVSIGRQNVLHILDSITFYNNAEYLDFEGNDLEDVPEQVKQFPRLRTLSLARNPLKILRNGSVQLTSSQLEMVLLYDCQITEIESDAFQGNFSETKIYLNQNGLVTGDKDVFLPLLTSMHQANARNGYINLDDNNFVCGCDLKWLVAENPHLFTFVKGKCSDGTGWDQLDPNGFKYCSDCLKTEEVKREISAYQRALTQLYHLHKENQITAYKDSQLFDSDQLPNFRNTEQ